MKNFINFAGDAFLLCRDGTSISVLNHPSAYFEFESILRVIEEYGTELDRKIVENYKIDTNENTKQLILSIYDNTWCKVREWEGRRLITFRITSTDSFDWYPVILEFLLEHPEYKNSNITVETDKRTGVRRMYWEELPYSEAISPENEMIIATKQIIYL